MTHTHPTQHFISSRLHIRCWLSPGLHLWLADLQADPAPLGESLSSSCKHFDVNESTKWIKHNHYTPVYYSVFSSSMMSFKPVWKHTQNACTCVCNILPSQNQERSISTCYSAACRIEQGTLIYRYSGRKPSSSSQYAAIHTYLPPTTRHLPTSSHTPVAGSSLAINPSFLNETLSSLSGWSNDSE